MFDPASFDLQQQVLAVVPRRVRCAGDPICFQGRRRACYHIADCVDLVSLMWL